MNLGWEMGLGIGAELQGLSQLPPAPRCEVRGRQPSQRASGTWVGMVSLGLGKLGEGLGNALYSLSPEASA